MGMPQTTVALAGACPHIFTTENRIRGIFYSSRNVEKVLVVGQHALFPTLTFAIRPYRSAGQLDNIPIPRIFALTSSRTCRFQVPVSKFHQAIYEQAAGNF